MKVNIKGTFLNGIEREISINFEIANFKLVEINKVSFPTLNSKAIYSETNNLFRKYFSTFIQKLNNLYIDCMIYSKELEELNKIKFDYHIQPTSEALVISIIDFILRDNNLTLPEFNNLKDLFTKISKHNWKELLNKYLPAQQEIQNKKIIAAQTFFEKRDYKSLDTELADIEVNYLNPMELTEYQFLKVVAELRNQFDNYGNLKEYFNQKIEQFKNNPDKQIALYFEFIKFAEDIRDTKLPTDIIKEFNNKYSLGVLTNEQKGYYYYLIGREKYSRGFYRDALAYLEKAYNVFNNLNNEEYLAKVYNTAVNCYLDNYFLNYGYKLAEKAIEIRKKIGSFEIGDSFGVMGNYYLKKLDYEKALEYFNLSKIELQKNGADVKRTNNYILKTLILANKLDEAEKLFNEVGENYCNKKEESFFMFIKLLFYYYKKDLNSFNQIFLHFNQTENFSTYDKFPLAWAYAFNGLVNFENGDYENGVKFINSAINIFFEDNYFFEAGYVSLYKELYKPQEVNPNFVDNEREDLFAKFVEHIDIVKHLKEDYFQKFFEENDIKDDTYFTEFFIKSNEITQYSDVDKKKQELNTLLKSINLF